MILPHEKTARSFKFIVSSEINSISLIFFIDDRFCSCVNLNTTLSIFVSLGEKRKISIFKIKNWTAFLASNKRLLSNGI